MSSRTSPPLPPSPHRSFLSPLHRPVGTRRALLALFLPIAAVFALPSLGMGALIWWRASKTWDSRERWSGTWLMTIVGLLVYGFVSWFYHPLPSLFHTLSVYLSHLSTEPRALVTGLQWLGLLWLLHLCFAPTCALILEGLHPLSSRVHLLPRESRERPEEMGLPIRIHYHPLLRTVSDRHALHQFSHLHREPPRFEKSSSDVER